MDNEVVIPNVDRDERIGKAFNHLFTVIFETEKISGDNVIWNFKNASFFHPFFLAPLAIYKKNCYKSITCTNFPTHIKSYMDLICFEDMFDIKGEDDLKEKLNHYLSKSYIPICRFELSKNNVDGIQTIIQKIIEKQSKADKAIKTPLSYFLGELICNISQHADSKVAYIYSQYLNKEKCLNVCIADSGITVYGSYVKTRKYLDEINDNEAVALKMANEGFSTKNLPEAENRGYGISSSKEMLVDGLKGAFFMLSGGAFHRHDLQSSDFIELPKPINWDGTIILMKIPVNVPEDFDYYEYVV